MENFDYLVIGGGTAGCVLANRLSEDPATTVLLLEAGAADGPPIMSDPALWPMLAGTEVDWGFSSTPQSQTDDAVHPLARGKVLGGSSSINALLHFRGHPLSYDDWETAGATGWNYQSVLPFLKRSETAPGRDPSYRGTSGPMRVGPSDQVNPLFDAVMDAAIETGYSRTDDLNGADGEGVSWSEVNVVDGARQSAADAYLRPVLHRRNLTVLTNAPARKLLIDKGACRGAVYSRGNEEKTAYARREVVLASGTIGSAQLLMVSGVGPADHLREVGVDVVADLPGIGENLQDHTLTPISYSASQEVGRAFVRRPLIRFSSGLSGQPDLQIIFFDFPLYPRARPGAESGYTVTVSLMKPASRGSIRLVNADPSAHPLIDPNYLGDERDMDRLLVGVRQARKIGEAKALTEWREAEVAPGADSRNDSDIRHYIRRSLFSYNHLIGTCRMGTDTHSVVDPYLRVHGISGLRIADASVMPSIISGNPNATVLAIAERAAAYLASSE
ncbi:GMC family oxidoreductase [Streptomyces polygonati]|uniref:GMC family oxidoreductase n=1 Tax=Streptomyces polygonati TaxID=1617087 RepID=A0ABV8HZC5_9ACTN